MANFFFNDQRNTANANAVWLTLAELDTITFGAGAMWNSTNGSALVLSGSNRVTVNGQLYGVTAIRANGNSNTVAVGTSGIVVGSVHGIFGNLNNLNNAGYISGGHAVYLGSASNLYNSGTIAGQDVGIVVSPSSTFSLVNVGTISGDYAVEILGTRSFSIINSGSLLSESAAIYASADLFGGTLTNSGLISGAVNLSGGAMITVTNSGTITGSLSLGRADDVLDSSAGHLLGTVYGYGGDDLLIGSSDANRMFGGDGFDELRGGGGDDRLSGGAGGDLLDGGSGLDVVSYSDAFGGILADLLTPSRGTGDAAGDTYTSIEGLEGSESDDQLFGDHGANRLWGNGGGDLLNGREGADIMRGGFGDDRYVVDNSGDRVIERSTAGTDTVTVTGRIASYTLTDNVENLILTAGAVNGTGNALANELTGNAAANVLAGKDENDKLHGGAGADVFVFDTALDAATNVDGIDDVLVGTDKLQLSRAIFTELNDGAALSTAAFFAGTAAHDADDRIVYDATTGALFYDADGDDAGAAVQFAQLTIGLSLSAADFILTG